MTIAQAIEESAWGQSSLAAQYHNLFGIKGTGPAGSVTLPTQEYEDGDWVTIDAQFAVYRNDAESIAGHAELLATSGYYARAMADRAYPDAFANNLTGVYATDPDYGANLIALMKLYNLYQYDTAPAATSARHPGTRAFANQRLGQRQHPRRHFPRGGHLRVLIRDGKLRSNGPFEILKKVTIKIQLPNGPVFHVGPPPGTRRSCRRR